MNPAKHMILLVDDDPALLRLLSIRLTAAGYDVVTADSGAQALVQLAVRYPHLVITDLRMEGMDGMALFDTMHRSHPTLPVIILTAHGSIPEAVAATQRGVFGFLTKPFDGKDLLAQVEKALRLSGPTANGASGAYDDDWRKAILTRSPLMEDVLRQVRLVAESDASVLIYGESGTGKELIAEAIHHASRRRARAFVPVNCGAIPESLLESELFGYTRGAFTGATHDHTGLFQSAHQGTLFLDEIGDMPSSPAGQTPARAAGKTGASSGDHESCAGRCADYLSDAPQSRSGNAARAFPRRSLLPPAGRGPPGPDPRRPA